MSSGAAWLRAAAAATAAEKSGPKADMGNVGVGNVGVGAERLAGVGVEGSDVEEDGADAAGMDAMGQVSVPLTTKWGHCIYFGYIVKGDGTLPLPISEAT